MTLKSGLFKLTYTKYQSTIWGMKKSKITLKPVLLYGCKNLSLIEIQVHQRFSSLIVILGRLKNTYRRDLGMKSIMNKMKETDGIISLQDKKLCKT